MHVEKKRRKNNFFQKPAKNRLLSYRGGNGSIVTYWSVTLRVFYAFPLSVTYFFLILSEDYFLSFFRKCITGSALKFQVQGNGGWKNTEPILFNFFLIESHNPTSLKGLFWGWGVSCVKIQKITNMLTLGQIKLYMGPVNKNPKKKIQNFDF